MRRALIKTLVEIAESDPRVILITADLGFMVVEEFADRFPTRFFNVGVAEANMIGLATGLASSGFVPFVYSIGTFASMRSYEQFRNGPILHHLPVRIAGIGEGFEYGHGGFTHYPLEDLGIARVQPSLTVIAPADHLQTAAAVRDTYDRPGPIYYRIGKRDDYSIPHLDGRFALGRAEGVREGNDVLMVTLGSISAETCAAAEALATQGVEATIAVVSSLRPAPIEDLRRLLSRFGTSITVEEHYVDCGLGSLVAEVAAEYATGCRVVRCGVRRLPVGASGSEAYMRDIHGLSQDGISRQVLQALGETSK